MGRFGTSLRAATACAVLALAACSRGGGSSSPLPAGAGASPSPAATPTAQPTVSTSGVVYDLPYDGTSDAPGYSVLPSGAAATAGAPIAGADVYVGPTLVLGSSAPSTVPTGISHALTSATGSFTIAGLLPGTYALTIFAPAPHTAVLHQDLVVSAASPNGTYFLTAPTATERAWLAQQSLDRNAFGALPLALDESAVEAARYWAAFMAANTYFAHCIPESSCIAGDTTPPPASYGPQDVSPQARFAYFHGFSGGGEGENIAAGYATWEDVDAAFMGEQAQCPNDSPTGCPFTTATGHFLNIIDTNYVWTGLAIATAPSGTA